MLMKGFFNADLVSAAVAACGKVFAPGSTKGWGGAEEQKLLDSLSEVVPPDAFRVTKVGCFASALVNVAPDAIVQDKLALRNFVVFLQQLMKIASTMAFLCARIENVDDAVRDHKLKPEVEASVSLLRTETNAATSWWAREGVSMVRALGKAVTVDPMHVEDDDDNMKNKTRTEDDNTDDD